MQDMYVCIKEVSMWRCHNVTTVKLAIYFSKISSHSRQPQPVSIITTTTVNTTNMLSFYTEQHCANKNNLIACNLSTVIDCLPMNYHIP